MNASTEVITETMTAFQRLDRLLENAISQADKIFAKQAGPDAFRGLHLNREDMQSLLQCQPGVPLLWTGYYAQEQFQEGSESDTSRLAWLQKDLWSYWVRN